MVSFIVVPVARPWWFRLQKWLVSDFKIKHPGSFCFILELGNILLVTAPKIEAIRWVTHKVL